MDYDMRDTFIIPTLVGEYDGAVEDRWGNRAVTGVYLLSHWLKVLLPTISQFQSNSYENFNDNEDIVSCEWTKEIFVNSSHNTLIKRVEDKYEALDGIEQGGIYYPKIYLNEMFNMSDVVNPSLQEFFKKFFWRWPSQVPK